MRFNEDENKLKHNHRKIEKTKKMFQDEFYTMCSIGRYEGFDPKQGKVKKIVRDKRSNITKALNYNHKRKEFEDDDKLPDPNETVMGELNFNVKNIVNEVKDVEENNKKDQRRRNRQQREKVQNIDLPPKRKLNAVKYYNSVLDKRLKHHRLINEWGLLETSNPYMEEIIRDTEEEQDFVNTMKIFARFNTPANHVNLMNSLLLEKNIRELIDYLKEAKRRGKHNLEDLDERLSKSIFRLLTDRLTYGHTDDNEQSDIDNEEKDVSKTEKFIQRKESVKDHLQRPTLKPPICCGISPTIASCPGYNSLNEMERILVEKLFILPK